MTDNAARSGGRAMPGHVLNARIFKGQMPNPAGRRTYNKLPKVSMYHVHCDCGYSSDHPTKAAANHALAEHRTRSEALP